MANISDFIKINHIHFDPNSDIIDGWIKVRDNRKEKKDKYNKIIKELKPTITAVALCASILPSLISSNNLQVPKTATTLTELISQDLPNFKIPTINTSSSDEDVL